MKYHVNSISHWRNSLACTHMTVLTKQMWSIMIYMYYISATGQKIHTHDCTN